MEESKELVIQTVQLSTMSDVFSIILSVVALIVTIIGFFASLKFYRDGVQLQNSANDALSKLEEKTKNIQDQIVGMFDKTLDAAISKGAEVDSSFDDLDKRLVSVKESLTAEAIKELGAAGDMQINKIRDIVNEQLSRIEEGIDLTRVRTENALNKSNNVYTINPNIYEAVLCAFKRLGDRPVSQAELKSIMKIPASILSSTIKKMVEVGQLRVVSDDNGFKSYVVDWDSMPPWLDYNSISKNSYG
ncbi:hypothetical protein CLV44_1166 [Marinobacterium halophilum]|uniref:Uncharacterized protein n=1 Tax=Marinobacterium halophilum TaxID=267374 RepID=A0A2P8ET85_9GAMM|nr:hypothetical protein [Marinobacterium halophilum]PSL12648.1 hypothetical protein CLV44_1166 [Marinobacterium halophilum]